MPFVIDPSAGVTIGEDIINEAINLFMSGRNEELNKLDGSVEPDATSLTFRYDLRGIQAGAQVDVDLETYRVWSVDGPSRTATVEPGMQGTASSAHATNALVRVAPRVSRATAFRALNAELQAIDATGLYAMA